MGEEGRERKVGEGEERGRWEKGRREEGGRRGGERKVGEGEERGRWEKGRREEGGRRGGDGRGMEVCVWGGGGGGEGRRGREGSPKGRRALCRKRRVREQIL